MDGLIWVRNMSQSMQTTRELVLKSLYMCGAYTPGEVPDQTFIAQAIDLLNMKLDFYSKDGLYIAYHSTVDFELEAGKANYTFSKNIPADVDCEMIAQLETCFLTYSSGQHPVAILKQEQIDYHYRNTNVRTIPAWVVWTPHTQYSQLTFYQTPDKTYSCTIRAKLMLSSLSLNDQLSNVPYYYQYFIMLDLAKLLCSFHTSGAWTPELEQMRVAAEAGVRGANKTSTTIEPAPELRTYRRGLGYAFWAGY